MGPAPRAGGRGPKVLLSLLIAAGELGAWAAGGDRRIAAFPAVGRRFAAAEDSGRAAAGVVLGTVGLADEAAVFTGFDAAAAAFAIGFVVAATAGFPVALTPAAVARGIAPLGVNKVPPVAAAAAVPGAPAVAAVVAALAAAVCTRDGSEGLPGPLGASGGQEEAAEARDSPLSDDFPAVGLPGPAPTRSCCCGCSAATAAAAVAAETLECRRVGTAAWGDPVPSSAASVAKPFAAAATRGIPAVLTGCSGCCCCCCCCNSGCDLVRSREAATAADGAAAPAAGEAGVFVARGRTFGSVSPTAGASGSPGVPCSAGVRIPEGVMLLWGPPCMLQRVLQLLRDGFCLSLFLCFIPSSSSTSNGPGVAAVASLARGLTHDGEGPPPIRTPSGQSRVGR